MKITRVITKKDSKLRLSEKELPENIKTDVTIDVDSNEKFQKIIGFGGAFTEAACYTIDKLSEVNQEKILKAYFDQENGLAYNIGRVSIHSCDFSLGNYTYIEEGDKDLETFNIERDEKWVIPTIKRAEAIRNDSIEILASPWSPPAFMKTTNEMNHGGKLLDEYRQSWADYYVRFIEEYEKRDIDIWGVTVQNEPAAVQVWDSCIYTAEEERDFVKNYLGPTFYKNDLEDKKIIIWDHNRDILIERATTVLSDEDASQYIWGTGIHWYVSEAFENVGEVHDRFPDKHLLFTEGTQEGGVHLGSWKTGERYARNMIGDLNNWVRGYLDWNLVLDEQGGPNHVGNYCDAPIIADTVNDEVIFNSSYYYIGHFSKYINKDAYRIKCKSTEDSLKVSAFKNPTGEIVIIVLNEEEADKNYKLVIEDEIIKGDSPGRSLQTIIVE